MAAMPKRRLPHLRREKSRHGRVKWFFRLGDGPRIRLPDDYDLDPASGFMQAYQAALTGSDVPKKPRSRYPQNTLGWLLDQYEQSAKFAALAKATRQSYGYQIKAIREKSGSVRLIDITERSIRRAREARAATPNAANAFLKVMKVAFAWGMESGLLDDVIDRDPAKEVKRIDIKTEGHHTWTVEEIERYEARWPLGTMERLALDLLACTGLRREDVYQIGRQHIKGGEIHVRASKTGGWIYLPVLPALQESIDATKTGELTLLLNTKGQPHLNAKAFGKWFGKACERAEVPGRAHGMRKAAATLVAERGATVHQMMAIFGWDSERMAIHYTRKANRKKISLEHGELLDRK
ncbi:tyrosine-type recombinase/integrase [Roseibium alexandrii]|uniref:Site-specific recombinase XerD n=1 Tax=Roseibium alexandrii (strain DSM 17067 / NCIMB 14079 / DFL-11) TaxID=244592 RepID=A0A5E8H392_ROSAD|nr:tyrosine-type recombinase/integrase [Roseibium alexandrii]EEE46495.2 Site-specific recombinase XerD [Roseibium alexandrii DFL-11]